MFASLLVLSLRKNDSFSWNLDILVKIFEPIIFYIETTFIRAYLFLDEISIILSYISFIRRVMNSIFDYKSICWSLIGDVCLGLLTTFFWVRLILFGLLDGVFGLSRISLLLLSSLEILSEVYDPNIFFIICACLLMIVLLFTIIQESLWISWAWFLRTPFIFYR